MLLVGVRLNVNMTALTIEQVVAKMMRSHLGFQTLLCNYSMF